MDRSEIQAPNKHLLERMNDQTERMNDQIVMAELTSQRSDTLQWKENR